MLARRLLVPGSGHRVARGVSQALAEPMAWNAPPTVITKLPNGVRVATQETFSEVPSVGVFIDAGYRNDTKGVPGTALMAEKLLATGTKKYPLAKLVSEVETAGATLDMSMGREHTALTMSVFKSDAKQAVDILSDLVANPGIENFDKEKAAILAKLESVDTPNKDVIFDRLHACAFRDSALGFSTVGPFDMTAAVTSAGVQDYISKNFTADKIVLASSGAIAHADLVKLAEASPLGSLKAAGPGEYFDKPYFCGAEINYRNDDMGPSAFVAVGWEGVPCKSADAVVFMLMASIIGSYKKDMGIVPGKISGNRVVNGIANKMNVGCADEFEAFSLNYKDTGVFGFYAVCDEVAVEHCVGELMFGINCLAHSLTEEEVQRGKRELKTALASGTGSSAEALADVGKQVLSYGRVVSPAEMTLRIDAVDSEEIKRVAYSYLQDQEVAIAALGPTHGLPSYLDMRRMTYMHRY